MEPDATGTRAKQREAVSPASRWRILLRAAAQSGGPNAADAIASEWLQASPDEAEPNLHLGRSNLRKRQWERAEYFLARVVSARPGNALAWLDLGSARVHRRNLGGAVEAFRTAMQCAPRSEKARARLYFALRRWGRLAESREIGAGWLNDFPASEWARHSVRDDAKARPLLLSIAYNLKRGDNAGAELELSLLAGKPGVEQLTSQRSWLKLAQTFRARRRYTAAIGCCELGLRAVPLDRDLRVLRANLALRTGDFGTASDVVQGVLVAGADHNPELWTDFALALLQQGYSSRGRRALEEAVGRREEGPSHRALFGNASAEVPFFGAEIEQALA